MSEIAVLVNGYTQWRFVPHGEISADELTTPRTLRYPPIPLGAELLCDGQPLGTVRCVRRAAFSRWTVVFDPVGGSQETVAGEENISREITTPEVPAEAGSAEGISQEITVTIPEDVPEDAVVDVALEGEDMVLTIGTPIDALAGHLDARILGTVEQLALTVEELSAKTDDALRAIDGIGPKRLLEIRAACDAVLNG